MEFPRGACLPAVLLVAGLALACSNGEGSGQVSSGRLFIEDCWNGRFDLNPDFFAGQPYLDDSLVIRVQNGDGFEEVSDGLLVVVRSLTAIRQNQLGQRLRVGIPEAVMPPGQPLIVDPDPPKVHLALYLKNSCPRQNATVYSVNTPPGSADEGITFHSLFSGDPNEGDAEDRLTHAEFRARFADPRKAIAGSSPPEFPPDVVSTVEGNFHFYFQRGQPAQRFP